MAEYTEFLLKQLDRVGHPHKKPRKGWINVRCVSGKHADRDPSLGIYCFGDGNVPAKCLACGLVTSWNGSKFRPGVATIIGATTIDGKEYDPGDPKFDTYKELEFLEREFAVIGQTMIQAPVSLPKLIEPWRTDYVRKNDAGEVELFISKKTLKKIPTYTWYDTDKFGNMAARICWPITIDGTLVAYTGRALSHHKLRWNTKPDGWPAKQCLFPYDLYGELDSVALVEGPTSALRFIDKGIPALGILGASNWSSDKINLLVKKGITNVLLCFDGDKAGMAATETISKSLDPYFHVGYVDFPKSQDPGNIPESLVSKIHKYVHKGF